MRWEIGAKACVLCELMMSWVTSSDSVRDHRFVQKGCEGQVGERDLGGDARFLGGRGDAGEAVATARRGGMGEQCGEGVEGVTMAADGGVAQRDSPAGRVSGV